MYYTLKVSKGNLITQRKRAPLFFKKKMLEKWVKEKEDEIFYSKNPINVKEALKKRV